MNAQQVQEFIEEVGSDEATRIQKENDLGRLRSYNKLFNEQMIGVEDDNNLDPEDD